MINVLLHLFWWTCKDVFCSEKSIAEKMRTSVNRPPTPDGGHEPAKDLIFQKLISIKLIESGEKERLMELLRGRLIECGWKDDMKAQCRYGAALSALCILAVAVLTFGLGPYKVDVAGDSF